MRADENEYKAVCVCVCMYLRKRSASIATWKKKIHQPATVSHSNTTLSFQKKKKKFPKPPFEREKMQPVSLHRF